MTPRPGALAPSPCQLETHLTPAHLPRDALRWPMPSTSLGGRRRRSDMGENRGSLGGADEPRSGPWLLKAMPGETGLSVVAGGAALTLTLSQRERE